MGIELNSDQIFAYYEANKWWHSVDSKQIFEISGAAGTGKTTSIRYILQELGLDPLREVLFVAFTGKAATQLARNGLPAKTCHSAFYEFRKVFDKDEDGKKIILPNGKFKTKGVFVKKERLKKRYKAIVIDEAPMINDEMKQDIVSFGLPIFALGDTNQLPPVFGKPVFLVEPDVILKKLMRQAEDDPIVYIAHRILKGYDLRYGVFGKSSIIRRSDLDQFKLMKADIILTVTNELRENINSLFRDDYLDFKQKHFPHVGEKVICRRNNWERTIGDNLYLTNGITGFVEDVNRESYNGKSIKIDFRPDFTNKCFHNLSISYKRLMGIKEKEDSMFTNLGLDIFEFAYAITVYSSQGSQWNNVICLAELYGSEDFKRKVLYTMVTRAIESVTLVLK